MPHSAATRQHVVWIVGIAVSLFASVTFAVGLPYWLRFWTENPPLAEATSAVGLPYGAASIGIVALGLAAVAVQGATSGLILWARRDSYAVVIATAMIVYGCVFVGVIGIIRANDPVWAEPARIVATLNRIGVNFVLFTFPNGKFVPGWTRWLVAALTGWSLIGIPFPHLGPLQRWDIAAAESVSVATVGVAAQIYRYGRVATPDERQQVKWITFGMVFTLLSWIVLAPALVFVAPPPDILYRLPPSAALTVPSYLFLAVAASAYYLANIVPPVAVAMAMLRRSLFQIDLIFNRTVTYGLVTVLVGAGVVSLGAMAQELFTSLLGASSGVFSSAAGLAAVLAFVPLRRRMQPLVDRLLPEQPVVTVMFADLVGSTALAVELGDRRWTETLQGYHDVVRRELRRHAGQLVDTAGDGVFAIFSRTEAAIYCARGLTQALAAAELRTRIGIHSGPCEMRGDKVIGTTVHVGARLVSMARPGEIMLSESAAGAVGLVGMTDEGERELKGLPGRWKVYSLPVA